MEEKEEQKEKYILRNPFEQSLLDKLPVGYRLLRNPDVAKSWGYHAKSTFHNTPFQSMSVFYKPISKLFLNETKEEKKD